MTRNLKALVLALLAVSAMGAVTATAAHAVPTFTAAKFPATLDATTEREIGKSTEELIVGGREVECKMATFKSKLKAASSTLTVTPFYTDHQEGGECKTGQIFKTTVTENGCDYQFNLTKKDATDYTGTMDILCPAGKLMEIHVRDVFGNESCTITIPQQKGLGTLTFKNNGNHIDVSGEVINVVSTMHSKNINCGVNPGESKEFKNGKIIISNTEPITFTGKEELEGEVEGEEDPIAITGE
jgi:hypothetical protein